MTRIIEQSGGTFASTAFTEDVLVMADDVTLENCTIDGQGAHYALQNDLVVPRLGRTPRNLKVLGGRIRGASRKGCRIQNARLEHCGVSDCGEDGIFMGAEGNLVLVNVLIERIGDLGLRGWKPGDPYPHADGVQAAAGSNLIMRELHVDMREKPGYASNACVIIKSSLGPISNVWLFDCALLGGNYCVYIIDDRNARGTEGYYGPPTRVRVIGNRVSDWRFGPYSFTHPEHIVFAESIPE